MQSKIFFSCFFFWCSFWTVTAQNGKIQSTVSNSYVTIIMCAGEEVILDGGEGDNDYYEWSTEEYEKTITVYDPGKYEVIITKEADENYLAKKIFYVKGVEGPAINRVVILEDNQTLKVIPREEGNYEYSIDREIYQASNIFKNLKNGPYEFFARDTDSCQAVGPVFRFIKL